MMSNRINSEALATMGSRCIVVTAVTLPFLAWYEANWGLAGFRSTEDLRRRGTYLQFIWVTISVNIVKSGSGTHVSKSFADR
jgi:hypothetical protein